MALPVVSIVEEPLGRLTDHSEIPIRFEVASVFEVEGDDPALANLSERPAEPAWIKDYDAIEGEGPTWWAKQWNISNWGLLAAYDEGQRIGGCVLAYKTDGVDKLEGRDDVAALWDIRIHPDWRGLGAGHQLFGAAVAWARERGCRVLVIETQNINVAACRFYHRQGCRLSSIDRNAYIELPDEVELMWSLAL